MRLCLLSKNFIKLENPFVDFFFYCFFWIWLSNFYHFFVDYSNKLVCGRLMQIIFFVKTSPSLPQCALTHSPSLLSGFSLFQQGVRFDPDLPQTIRLEFAKSNTKVSKPKQHSPATIAGTITQPPLVHPLTGRKYICINLTLE